MNEPAIECQDCGQTLHELTPAEQQRVADRPYDFVLFCASCGRERERRARAEAP